MTTDRIELRMPLKLRYLNVLRAATGVIAGTISMNYDEVMQLRVATSAVFESAIKHLLHGEPAPEVTDLAVSFAVHPDRIEIVMTDQAVYAGGPDSEDHRESLDLLRSLVDEVEFGIEADGKTFVRMVKTKSAEGT